MTPPEPVTWPNQISAIIITTGKAWALSLKWRLSSTVSNFCSTTRPITNALVWTCLFPSSKNKSNFSLPVIDVRVGISYNNNIYQTLILLFFGLIIAFINSPEVIAKSTISMVPTRLIIPSIALDSAVVPVGWKEVEVNGQTYAQWEVDKNLVGWHNLSAPLGQVGNSVLNGHSNIYAQVFRNLDQIKVGDSIVAMANNKVFNYIVVSRLLVQEKGVSVEKRLENAKLILPTSDERLTLVTCAQAEATHRLIIVAHSYHSYR